MLVAAATHVSTWLAVAAVGARPVGVEPDATGTLDPDRLEGALTARTTAVLPVHLAGQPAAMAPIVDWARNRGLTVVADGAQAHGARYGDRPIGALGDVVAWSFYPSKNLGALGDAGAVTTNDPAVADRVTILRNYGSERRDVVVEVGVNSRLDELQAALLRVRLRHLDAWQERRTAVARRYLEALEGLPLGLPAEAPGTTHAWHHFAVTSPQRDLLRRRLADAGVETLVHYPTPPLAQPAFATLGIDRGRYPRTMAWAAGTLSLPAGPHLAVADQERVIAALRRAAAPGG